MSDLKVRVAISQGDINGIGWEVILKTFADPSIFDLCSAVVYGSSKTASQHRKSLNSEEYQFAPARDADQANPRKLNVVNVYEEDVPVEFGKPSDNGGKYALLSLEGACNAMLQGKADVLLTAPINKHTIQSAQFPFTGHTTYLQNKFSASESLMMLCAPNMKVGLVTDHVPVSEIATGITIDSVFAKILLMNSSLIRDFGIRRPKIAVLGLNPHSGDGGTIGREELDIIIPAINKAKEMNLNIYGTYAADGFFGNGAYSSFDGVLAMYHDQGLAPFKALSFSEGVNFTAGLPIVRTSPDHGTGFDIAGQNKANEASFRAALYFAIDVFRKRLEYQSISASPLVHEPGKKER